MRRIAILVVAVVTMHLPVLAIHQPQARAFVSPGFRRAMPPLVGRWNILSLTNHAGTPKAFGSWLRTFVFTEDTLTVLSPEPESVYAVRRYEVISRDAHGARVRFAPSGTYREEFFDVEFLTDDKLIMASTESSPDDEIFRAERVPPH